MHSLSFKNNWKNFFIRIILPAILAIALFIISIFAFILPSLEENYMDHKRAMIKELTNSVWSILSKYELEERSGTLTRDTAQMKAVEEIWHIRYGEEMKDYFWITDMQPNMIMHPYRSDLNGKPLNDFKDAHGKKLFVEFVNIVKKDNEGYVDYMWQWKDDSLQIVPKLSFVKLFKPWGWIIGTGIYIEDVKIEIKNVESRLVKISLMITLFISLLLFFIMRQSIRIEQKRIETENDLQESKEKYRTLVEAATEGLIMLVDGKISFLNKVICKMTGYEENELLNHPLNYIISENNNKDTIEFFSKDIIPEGQYDINIKKKNGGTIEALITSSDAVLSGKSVNLIIVKDITIDRNSSLSILDYQKLISTLDMGFFRARIDAKGKFIFANETAIRILGFNNFRELSNTYVLEMLADYEDRKNLRKILIENGFIKNKVLKIHKKNSENSFVAVSLVVFNNEDSRDIICDGIIEDITIQEKEKTATRNLIVELKTNSFLMEQSVKSYLTPVTTMDLDATIGEAVKLLSKRKTDNILLSKNTGDYFGIVTNSDIQKRVLSLKLHTDNPVYLIMSSPVIYTDDNTTVFDAITICEENSINHLVVKDMSNEIAGILSISNIYKSIKDSLSFFTGKVKKSVTNDELRLCNESLQLYLKPLIGSEISVNYITKITSAFSDSVAHRIIELAINEIGTPPAEFSFICLGSEGRKEETLFTDQDNAIIYEDVPRDREDSVNKYFITLGEKVCNSLDQIGYSLCKGNIMAKNRQWCKPISAWEKYFAEWISTPEPQNLLDATIFFDFRNIYGNISFTERLRSHINVLIKDHPLFLYHLAFNTCHAKSAHVSSGNIISDKNSDFIDLKNAVIPFIMFARTYALQNNIGYTNTLERLAVLKSKQIINESTIDEIVYAYNFLMKLRFKNQLWLMEDGLPPSNALNTKKLIDIELFFLKKVLSIIPVFQNKISVDFRVSN